MSIRAPGCQPGASIWGPVRHVQTGRVPTGSGGCTLSDRESQLRQRLELDPEDGEALRELASLVGEARDRKAESVELWQRYVETVAEDGLGEALFSLASAQIGARQEADAVATLRRCVEVEPDWAEAFDLLGEVLRRAGELEGAAEALERAASLDPEAVRPRVALATVYDAMGRRDEASELLRSLGRRAADNPALRALVQELMHRRG